MVPLLEAFVFQCLNFYYSFSFYWNSDLLPLHRYFHPGWYFDQYFCFDYSYFLLLSCHNLKL